MCLKEIRGRKYAFEDKIWCNWPNVALRGGRREGVSEHEGVADECRKVDKSV